MSSKLNPVRVCRSLAMRSRPILPQSEARVSFQAARRGLADGTTLRPDDADAASMTPPRERQPYVPPPPEYFAPNYLNAEAVARLEKIAANEALEDDDVGHKFGLPEPIGKKDHLKDRYPAVIEQVTKLMMQDGKLSQAQRNMSMILDFLRKSPAPKVSPLRPLLPGSPPPSQLPLNPELYLTLAIDSVAPLLRVRNMKGMAGGGMALEVPEPLAARQRRRIAVMWILDIVNKKKSRTSGRSMFAARLADEIIAVVEGKSQVWDKRQQVHKIGTASRANLNHPAIANRRGRS